MSKDLKNEYKELMTEDVPDLWDRIEAGLEPKQPTAEKRNPWGKYRVWRAAVAACLCLMVTVPVILREGKGGNYSTNDMALPENNAQADGAAAENENGSIAFEAIPENNYSDMAAEEAAELGESESVMSTEEAAAVYSISAKVLEVLEEGGTAYIVQIEESDNEKLSAGDEIKLYPAADFEEKLAEGESYLLDISVLSADDGTAEYLINNITNEAREKYN